MSWELLANIATAIGLPVVCTAAVFAYLQLKEMAAARWTEATAKVFEMLIQDEETRKARRYVRTCQLPLPGEATEEQWNIMYRVWVSFDNLGVLVAHKMLPAHLSMEMFHGSIIECWEKLAPHIHQERAARGGRYQVFFEDLYCRSIEYRNSHYKNPESGGPIRLRKAPLQARPTA